MKKIFTVVLIMMLSTATAYEERFPEPTSDEFQESEKIIESHGKAEVFSLSYSELFKFLWNRYVRGPSESFQYYGCNPATLTSEQACLPATILLHANSSNQGQWIPLINALEKVPNFGPVFTFNFDQKTDLLKLIQKIEAIVVLYQEAGENHVSLNLVGHSLGTFASSEYAFDPDLWVNNTTVKKVISIAGRLKNIEPPTESPHYAYCYDILERVESIWEKIQKNRGIVELYTIAAENDWLVPQESVLVGDDDEHKAIIPDTGHVLVPYNQSTHDFVIQWLLNEK